MDDMLNASPLQSEKDDCMIPDVEPEDAELLFGCAVACHTNEHGAVCADESEPN